MRYRRTYIKEDLDLSLPPWLRKEITSSSTSNLKTKLVKMGIALDKVKFIQSDLPTTSNQITKMKQSGKYPIFFINNRDVYIPGIYGDNSYNFKYNNYYKNIPMKNIMADSTDFGYIDLKVPENVNTQLRIQRKEAKAGSIDRGRGQYLYKYTKYIPSYKDPVTNKWVDGHTEETGEQEWITNKGQDKSGYIPDPDKYKKILDDIGLNNYSIRLDAYYKRLNKVKSKIIDIISNWDIKEQPQRVGQPYDTYTPYNLLSLLDDASDTYRNLLHGIEAIIEKEDIDDTKKDELIRDYFSSSYWGISDLRDKVERVEKPFKEIF